MPIIMKKCLVQTITFSHKIQKYKNKSQNKTKPVDGAGMGTANDWVQQNQVSSAFLLNNQKEQAKLKNARFPLF